MKYLRVFLVFMAGFLVPIPLASSQQVRLEWAAGTDDITVPANLTYEVRQAVSPTLDSVAAAELNGAIVRAYAPAVTATVAVTVPSFFNVIVKDETGNKAVYAMVGPVIAAPVIGTQPVNVRVIEGQAATFSVVASGGALRYRWLRNGLLVSGATSAVYTTPVTRTSDNNKWYNVIVSNDSGSVMSISAVLTVKKK